MEAPSGVCSRLAWGRETKNCPAGLNLKPEAGPGARLEMWGGGEASEPKLGFPARWGGALPRAEGLAGRWGGVLGQEDLRIAVALICRGLPCGSHLAPSWSQPAAPCSLQVSALELPLPGAPSPVSSHSGFLGILQTSASASL